MVYVTLVIGMTQEEMVLVNRYGPMEADIKDFGKIMNVLEKDDWTTQMDLTIRESFVMEKHMEKVFMFIAMEL